MTDDPSDRDEGPSSDRSADRSGSTDDADDRDDRSPVRESADGATGPADPPESPSTDKPPRVPGREANVPNPTEGPISAVRWFFRTETGPVVFVREVAGSALAVLAIGALLFAVSGVWPPMVAVESGSMTPHLVKGDLVFVMAPHRMSPDYAVGNTGIVTYDVGKQHDYTTFGEYGNVIIYRPYGSHDRKPVIHRARFWVNKGENWYGKANPAYLTGPNCAAIPNCPAPYAGFVTKGDNNRTNNYYDQERGISDIVKPSWVVGKATVRIPWLGWVRLTFSNLQVAPGQSRVASVGY